MKRTFLLILILFTIFSCKKDDDFNEIPTDNPTQTVSDAEFAQDNFGEAITTNFIGQVFNTSGEKLSGVEITIGNQQTFTDQNGVFVLNNASAYDKFAFVSASKTGYINGSKTILPTPNGVNDIQITLLKKEIIGSVSSGENSEITLPNGSKVEFQGDFIDSTGNPYNGQVDVSMNYLEPNAENIFSEMPGMLFGMQENGSASGMETYGMLAINLFSPGGEQLNILDTTPATITFPVSVSTPNAPSEIPLWYFDEATGYWKEQGKATRVGNTYVGEVTHFSWWNCDLSVQVVTVCFELSSINTLPNTYFEIIRNATGQLMFSGFTNEDGEECILFPVNEEVTFNVYGNSCTDPIIYTETLGSFSSDTTIDINITALPVELVETTIIGTVNDCNGTSLENGYLFLFNTDTLDLSDYELIPITNGNISHDFIYCSDAVYSAIVYDLTANQSSDIIEIVLSPGETNINIVSACGNQNGGTYLGDLILYNQEDINIFGLFGYTSVEGSLTIFDEYAIIGNGTNDIVTLTPLGTLTSVLGDLAIVNNPLLSNLSGLNNLTTVGGKLEIRFMEIESLSGLESLNYVDGLDISSNPNLATLNGLENLSNSGAEDFRIGFNEGLTSLSGLENLESIGGNFTLTENALLTQLSGLENLTTNSGDLRISVTNLTSINSLSNLNTIGGSLFIDYNDDLLSLNGLENISVINGFVSISHNNALTSLSGLDGLTSITDNLHIADNESLLSLSGLNNLSLIGEFTTIRDNPLLTSLDGLNSLSQANNQILITENNALVSFDGLDNLHTTLRISVNNNPNLTSLSGLSALTNISDLIINNNAQLASLSDFTNLTELDYLYFENNQSLTSLNGLENINSVIGLIISGSTSLQTLSGLDGLVSIEGFMIINDNSSLTSLSGLENLFSINELLIGTDASNTNQANVNLANFCALTNLFTNGTSTTVSIVNNAYNPTVQDIIDGNCSQ